jgi:hypothetical protein
MFKWDPMAKRTSQGRASLNFFALFISPFAAIRTPWETDQDQRIKINERMKFLTNFFQTGPEARSA